MNNCLVKNILNLSIRIRTLVIVER